MAERHAVCVAVRTHDRPHYLPPTLDDALAEVRQGRPGEEMVLWGIIEQGQMAGVVTSRLRDESPDTLWAQVEVLPQFRRRGFGARALYSTLEYAAYRNRRRLVGVTHCKPAEAGHHEHRVFLEHNGFRLIATDLICSLALPVPRVLLQGVQAQTLSAYFDRYRVQTYDWVPDELLPSLLELVARVDTESPTIEIDWQSEPLGLAGYLAERAADSAAGRARITAVAVDRETDQAVGYSEVLLRPGITRASQRATFVRPGHRGCQLGLALVTAAVARLQEQHPDRRDMHTERPSDSPWMLTVHESLGFRPIELTGLFQRELL